jgi:hypothetical protein
MTYRKTCNSRPQKIFNKELPFKANGYRSVIEFVSNMPNVVRIERPDPNGDWLLFPVGVNLSSGG